MEIKKKKEGKQREQMDIFAEAEIREICREVPSDSFLESLNWRQFPYLHNV